MQSELELPLILPEPEISPTDIERFLRVVFDLSENPPARGPDEKERVPGWFTAAEIAERMGDDTTDRRVRKLASAACPGVVSFPGSPGYKLWQQCSVEEINHCIEAFESQGSDMLKRSVLYRQAYHRRFRGAPAS